MFDRFQHKQCNFITGDTTEFLVRQLVINGKGARQLTLVQLTSVN